MACGCNRKQNGGCNRRPNFGCNNADFQEYDDFLDIFEASERCTGPYTWNGYVWYDIEVEYSGPFFGSYRRPEPRGCGNRRNGNGGCGCGCND